MSFFSINRSDPLQIWSKTTGPSGSIAITSDNDIHSSVIELSSSDIKSCYIQCPSSSSMTLGIKLSYLALIIKNMNDDLSFEVTIIDDRKKIRRVRASTFQVM